MLFSATWPKEIQQLAHDFLKDPVQINVGEVNALVANKDIKQNIHMISEDEKIGKLESLLKEITADADGHEDKARVANGGKAHAKVIVFVAKKISCNDLANKLWEDGFAVDCLHGDRPQWERSKVMGAFKNGALRMLIATDVAARGELNDSRARKELLFFAFRSLPFYRRWGCVFGNLGGVSQSSIFFLSFFFSVVNQGLMSKMSELL
jgi:ATP-dependent RNA helicase DDX5/DBP2